MTAIAKTIKPALYITGINKTGTSLADWNRTQRISNPMAAKSIKSANFLMFVLLLITEEITVQTKANSAVAIATSVKTLSRVDVEVVSNRLNVWRTSPNAIVDDMVSNPSSRACFLLSSLLAGGSSMRISEKKKNIYIYIYILVPCHWGKNWKKKKTNKYIRKKLVCTTYQ